MPDLDLHNLGFTRSVVHRRHALVTPDAHVRAALPGWFGSTGNVLISPRMGAAFTQYLVEMNAGGSAAPALPGIERFLYVLAGRLQIEGGAVLGPGGFAFLPANGAAHRLVSDSGCRLNVFEKRYAPMGGPDERDQDTCGQESLPLVTGNVDAVPAEPYLGDAAARLQVLLPDTEAFDLAVNVFTFAPGAAHPFVEVHVMEHGLLMLQGGGIYRLDRAWYPVQAGDAIWMGPYCAQWFCAVGKEPARYLYCKDVNRDPPAAPAGG